MSEAPCILLSSEVGGGEKTRELKGFVRFLGAVVSQFSMEMDCVVREQQSTMVILLH